ncbi:hypothetical protein LOOC260_114390 [Paucilactobacillus hokkaidonensis JCM 18461]|uniref:Uncharacterized protein n=3 Tax=Paucilactobacillus hokkaidonensis TaxID=1193095 RepID=A0A0A1GVF6_9LACO|nr:hypothetical protein [Paucilactobacillus hokkaidonensis]KRO05799.1 hypothetical protein IV59_GL002195 [Paucilactobacillus hokkaidonensis]BAP85975.1 hypothetical protein LOOC260_114390 [Paucilactobacillus hokkaidonensis JCM 18461]
MKIQVINELNNDPVLIIFDNAKTKTNKFSIAKDQLLGDTNLIAEQLRECARELVNYRTEKSER